MSIKAKLAIIFTALIAFAVLSIGYSAYIKASSMMLDFTEKNLSTEAQIFADQVDRFLDDCGNKIIALAQHPGLRSMDTSAEEKSLILKEAKEGYVNFRTIALADTEGLQYADSDGYVGVMKDQLEWFKGGMSGEMHISDVRISQDLKKAVVNYGYPVRDYNENIIGVINTRLDLEDTIWSLVDQFADLERKAGRKGYAFMINQEGFFIAHPEREMVLRDNILTLGVDTVEKEYMIVCVFGQNMGKGGFQ
ncbi:MAG: cache domain-containing protein [Desulfotomaculaceae bacterium]|nr:cache domain-containing protein [Desulfotomaculaceae bacterium]